VTQGPRTTETMNRDNGAIREIMHDIRELTVPDRATLAVGLVGHLATMMNRAQLSKLMTELQTEAEKVQDVPPSRQRDGGRDGLSHSGEPVHGRQNAGDAVMRAGSGSAREEGAVGQAGRGEFRSGELL